MKSPALFLDRDGVINVDLGYVHRPEQIEFIDGIFDLVLEAKKSGFFTVVVTNQAGIGRGYFTEQDFWKLTEWMQDRFKLETGYPLDAVYFCPDHPTEAKGKYLRDSNMRKPGPGMILLAAKEHNLDLSRSIMIGDKESDQMASENAGVGRFFFLSTENRALGPRYKTVYQILKCFSG